MALCAAGLVGIRSLGIDQQLDAEAKKKSAGDVIENPVIYLSVKTIADNHTDGNED